MAYVAKAPQGRRQDEGDVGGGQDYGTPTGGVQGTPKQSSMAKTPMQEQVKQAQGRDQSAAANRIYKPVQNGFERAAGELARGAGEYEQRAAKETQDLYGADQAAVQSQLRSKSLSAPLQQVAAGQKKEVGKLDLKVPMFQAATEIMKGGTSPGLQRASTGKYTGGMAALDSQLLKKSGALGQLIPKVQEGAQGLRGLQTSLNRDVTAGAEKSREEAFKKQRSAIENALRAELSDIDTNAQSQFDAITGVLQSQRDAARQKGTERKAAALKELADLGFEASELQGLDPEKYLRDVVGPQSAAQMLGTSRDYAEYLADLEGKLSGQPAAALPGDWTQSGQIGFDEAGFNAELDKLMAPKREQAAKTREARARETEAQNQQTQAALQNRQLGDWLAAEQRGPMADGRPTAANTIGNAAQFGMPPELLPRTQGLANPLIARAAQGAFTPQTPGQVDNRPLGEILAEQMRRQPIGGRR